MKIAAFGLASCTNVPSANRFHQPRPAGSSSADQVEPELEAEDRRHRTPPPVGPIVAVVGLDR